MGVYYESLAIDPYIQIFNAMKSKVPVFEGCDPKGWLSQIEELFDSFNTPEEWRLRLVSYHMEGRADEWLLCSLANGELTSWSEFRFKLQLRFAHESRLKELMDEVSARIEKLRPKAEKTPPPGVAREQVEMQGENLECDGFRQALNLKPITTTLLHSRTVESHGCQLRLDGKPERKMETPNFQLLKPTKCLNNFPNDCWDFHGRVLHPCAQEEWTEEEPPSNYLLERISEFTVQQEMPNRTETYVLESKVHGVELIVKLFYSKPNAKIVNQNCGDLVFPNDLNLVKVDIPGLMFDPGGCVNILILEVAGHVSEEFCSFYSFEDMLLLLVCWWVSRGRNMKSNATGCSCANCKARRTHYICLIILKLNSPSFGDLNHLGYSTLSGNIFCASSYCGSILVKMMKWVADIWQMSSINRLGAPSAKLISYDDNCSLNCGDSLHLCFGIYELLQILGKLLGADLVFDPGGGLPFNLILIADNHLLMVLSNRYFLGDLIVLSICWWIPWVIDVVVYTTYGCFLNCNAAGVEFQDAVEFNILCEVIFMTAVVLPRSWDLMKKVEGNSLVEFIRCTHDEFISWLMLGYIELSCDENRDCRQRSEVCCSFAGGILLKYMQ